MGADREMIADRIQVLIVDDEPSAVQWLSQALAAAQCEIRTAIDGEGAIAQIQVERPDAVLLDVCMPGIDGFDTCRQLRIVDSELPVIFMTGLGETEHVVSGFAAGATDYVTKPLVIDEVIARLRSHTRTSRLLRQTRELLRQDEQGGAHLLAHTLTSRESEVLLWVSRGKTNRDIADILGMSPRTVNKHLEHVFEKLGVETRTAAAAAARRLLGS